MDLRPVTADEFEALLTAAEGAFHEDVHADDLEELRGLFEPARSLMRITSTCGCGRPARG
jgi:hypothetical protein